MAKEFFIPEFTGTQSLATDVVTTDVVQADGGGIWLDDLTILLNSRMERVGSDLVLTLADGGSVVIEGYFTQDPPPVLRAGQATLTPELVDRFLEPDASGFVEAGPSSAEPVGSVSEIKGVVTVLRADGSRVQLENGDPIHEGDVVETGGQGSMRLSFADESVFTIGRNAKMSIDELVYDPASGEGLSALSLLKGGFTFVSGLIAKNDPESVGITTPVATIGIRGTVLSGLVDPDALSGEVLYSLTVIDGAIEVSSVDGTVLAFIDQSLQTVEGFSGSAGAVPVIRTSTVAEVIRSASGAFQSLNGGDVQRI